MLALGASVLLVGCGGEAATTGEDAELKELVTLTFSADWREEASGPLVVGRKVRVVYDTERLPGCRGDFNGHPGWTITGFASQDGEEAETFEAGGFSPSGGSDEPIFQLLEPGDLAIWFQITNRWGCSEWDSDFGANYHFDVAE
jgi:hypothetical protein